jgi:hypothetical protein
MAKATTADQATEAVAEAVEAEASGVLTCGCWDCRSHRRHLLKLAAMVLLACGLGGELGWQRGLWRANEAAPIARLEQASVAAAGDASWF